MLKRILVIFTAAMGAFLIIGIIFNPGSPPKVLVDSKGHVIKDGKIDPHAILANCPSFPKATSGLHACLDTHHFIMIHNVHGLVYCHVQRAIVPIMYRSYCITIPDHYYGQLPQFVIKNSSSSYTD